MAYTGKAYTWNAATLNTFNEVGGVYWVAQLPKTPGGDYPVIYVGRTDNFKRRLAEHYNDKTHCLWGYAPSHVFAEVISTEVGRIARETAEIRAYKAARQAPCNEQFA